MYNKQNADKFINKLNEYRFELQRDFNDLQPEEKRKVEEYISGMFKMWGIFLEVDAVSNIINAKQTKPNRL